MTAPVAALSPARDTCPVCDRPPTWQVGPDARSCTRHVGDVLADLYAAEPRPFAPHLPVPLYRGNW